MRILLIYPKAKIWNMPRQIPLGLAYIGAVLHKNGYYVEVFDTSIEERSLIQKIKRGKFDLIGLSATTPLIKNAWEIASTVKKISSAPIVLGGPHPSALPEESLKDPNIDMVVRGEGEEAIIEICQYLSGKREIRKIAGLSYKKNGKIVHNKDRVLNNNLDSLPYPLYSLFKIGKYSVTQPLIDRQKSNSKAFYIMTSRGCPFGCVYCFKGINGRSWRPFSPERVVMEWEYLIKELHATEIGVQDDLFNFDKNRAMQICDLIISKNLQHVPWITNNGIRADKVDLKLLQKMKEAGCIRVAFGVESGSQKILNNIQKNLTLKQIRHAFVLAKKADLETMGFFMFGNPGETEKTMNQTINFANELNPDVAHFSIATPFPGTPLRLLIGLKGKFNILDWDNYGTLEGTGFFTLGKVIPELVAAKWREAYRRFYLRPNRLLREVTHIENWLNIKLLFRAGRKYLTQK